MAVAYQSLLGLSLDERDSLNHACWSEVWFMTRSSISFMPLCLMNNHQHFSEPAQFPMGALPLVACTNQILHVLDRAIRWVNVLVVRDIIAHVHLWTIEPALPC